MSIERTGLANGLRIVTDRMEAVETVTLGVWVGAGTRNEAAEVNGVSHLLEHMAFKGTAKRSAMDIAVEIENVGGHLNAYTSREMTAYYATVLKDDLALALDMIADILQHSLFDETELARERSVVLQEIGQANDTPDDIIFDHFQETAYPDQPLGRPVLGTAATVRNMPRRTLVDYMAAEYGSGRMVLSAAGNLDHAAVAALADRAFGGMAGSGATTPAPAAYRGGDYRESRDLEQVHFVLGFDGVCYDDDDYYPLAVLSTALGGGMSSRLFQEVREKRGLVYTIHSFTSAYTDGGLFGLYAGTGEAETEELVPVVCDEICRAATGPFDADEIARARAQIKAGVLMSLESTSSRAERLARQIMVYGRTIPTDEIARRIDAVTAEDLRRVATRIIASAPTVAAAGPIGRLESWDAIGARLAV